MYPLTPKQRSDFLDKAAMMVMQELLGSAPNKTYDAEDTEILVKSSYYFAQALLAERDRRTEEK